MCRVLFKPLHVTVHLIFTVLYGDNYNYHPLWEKSHDSGIFSSLWIESAS